MLIQTQNVMNKSSLSLLIHHTTFKRLSLKILLVMKLMILLLILLKGQEQRATSDAKDAEQLQKRASTKTVPTGSIPVPSSDTTISPGDVLVPTGCVPVPTGSPTDSFFDDEPTTRFPSLSDLGNNEPSPGIFSSSSYDDEFGADLNNLASTMEVSPVETKRINTIHPQSLIIGDHTSAVQTRSKRLLLVNLLLSVILMTNRETIIQTFNIVCLLV
ncbi:hypothetical protein Tco_0239500, partial [Tanacetum coccineum]